MADGADEILGGNKLETSMSMQESVSPARRAMNGSSDGPGSGSLHRKDQRRSSGMVFAGSGQITHAMAGADLSIRFVRQGSLAALLLQIARSAAKYVSIGEKVGLGRSARLRSAQLRAPIHRFSFWSREAACNGGACSPHETASM